MLTKEQILTADDKPIEKVMVPEWGDEVYVRTMSGKEKDAFEQSIVETNGDDIVANMHNMRAKLGALCMVDGDGKLLFSNDEVELLGDRSALALDRVFVVAQKLNGLQPDDIETLAKN